MKNEIKRKIASYILAGTIVGSVSAKSFADDVDMTPIDINSAIADLIPDERVVVPSTVLPQEQEQQIEYPVSIKEAAPQVEGNLESQEDCVHVYNEWPDDVANQVTGTCTEDGSYDDIYYCTKCGAMKIVHVNMAHPGHNWITDNQKYDYVPATYDKEGSYKIRYTCNNKGCKASYEEVYIIPKLIPPVYPTCTPGPQKGPQKGPVVRTMPETGDDKNLELYEYLLALGLAGTASTSIALVNQKKKVLTFKRK